MTFQRYDVNGNIVGKTSGVAPVASKIKELLSKESEISQIYYRIEKRAVEAMQEATEYFAVKLLKLKSTVMTLSLSLDMSPGGGGTGRTVTFGIFAFCIKASSLPFAGDTVNMLKYNIGARMTN
eukprot:scaffold271586_cov52-Attheya_sp.AAC.1